MNFPLEKYEEGRASGKIELRVHGSETDPAVNLYCDSFDALGNKNGKALLSITPDSAYQQMRANREQIASLTEQTAILEKVFTDMITAVKEDFPNSDPMARIRATWPQDFAEQPKGKK